MARGCVRVSSGKSAARRLSQTTTAGVRVQHESAANLLPGLYAAAASDCYQLTVYSTVPYGSLRASPLGVVSGPQSRIPRHAYHRDRQRRLQGAPPERCRRRTGALTKMKFSNFLFPAAMTPDLDHQVIHETLREAQLCEELGMDMLWLAEHHFDGVCAYVDPVTFAAALAARTTQIQIGFAVAQMSLHHPIRLAEQMDLMYHISR